MFQNQYPYEPGDVVFRILEAVDFTYPSYGKLSEAFLAYQKKHKDFKLEDFLETLESELRAVFDELYLYATYKGEEEENLEKLAFEIKKLALKRQISDLTKKSESFSGAQEKTIRELTVRLKDVEKMLLPV